MKIKKDTPRVQLQKLPKLKIRYTFAVPLMGIVDMLTMLSFYNNPVFENNTPMKWFTMIAAIVGLLFALWAVLWNTTADGNMIRVRPVIGRKKDVPLSSLKKTVIHKKAKGGSLSYYELIDKNGQLIVKIYPLMKDSSLLLERLKRLQIPMEEALGR